MISLLVVNYRSAGLAVAAMRSARAAARHPIQVVVVDNSCDEREAAALAPHADALLVSPSNLGYGKAINRGRPACSGSLIVVTNPDVVFGPAAIDILEAAFADDTVAVAGPALFWDEAHTWLLPPSELLTALEKLSAVVATRWKPWASRRDRRRVRQRLHFWSLQNNTFVPAISGAVMAIRATDFDACGGFDESFPLYFEETDFLRRLRGRGRRTLYVPAARCRHLYNQSAGEDSVHAAAAYAHSELVYLAKWAGRPVAATLKRLEQPPFLPQIQRLDGPLSVPGLSAIVEASPLADFSTAAGHFPTADRVEVPEDVWNNYRGDVLYLRTVDRNSGRPLATYARYRS